ncbi:hypothetical protein MNB_SV-5-961 [hydrothermal vent metagenome]|uniref:Uncharacterized protein n=1 Tax=hydrothermal vent metagenome TaxID=652676 RepID=A0A1W1EG47_9ZZZZ
MFTINVDKECGCFKRSMYENNQMFHDKDTALIEATTMLRTMNEDFCNKHEFSLSENGETFQVIMSAKSQDQSISSGGGG